MRRAVHDNRGRQAVPVAGVKEERREMSGVRDVVA